ncbi:MAG: GNAT family N-acetyltransferase [Thermocrispum sp.]
MRVRCAGRWLAQRGAGTGYVFAVLDERGEPVGNVAVGKVDPRHQTGWVAYWLVEQARGRGLAAQACRALARGSFDELGLFRLELGHRVDNPASCRVAVAAGFAAEGLERCRLRYGSERFDTERHAWLATGPEPSTTARSGSPGTP